MGLRNALIQVQRISALPFYVPRGFDKLMRVILCQTLDRE
jgi:hypothetical protein